MSMTPVPAVIGIRLVALPCKTLDDLEGIKPYQGALLFLLRTPAQRDGSARPYRSAVLGYRCISPLIHFIFLSMRRRCFHRNAYGQRSARGFRSRPLRSYLGPGDATISRDMGGREI
jgi:hypothetical protein